ncbi:transposase [Corynebacterium belfantii]|uniref:transposase n=1 Tax=Corynebacterium belfantii TaxID=2014537 RepID=UPI0018D46A31|nr:transposase [Corynebacterium belfantii]MBG9333545.1 transposase [Corynebacterium belfantii]
MTSAARQDPADKTKIDAIEKKLLANPEIAKLIDKLGTSTTDANNLVQGMVQASITRGLNAEMDAHLGYESDDRSTKTAGTNNHRNGSYPKIRGFSLRAGYG